MNYQRNNPYRDVIRAQRRLFWKYAAGQVLAIAIAVGVTAAVYYWRPELFS